MGTNQWTCSPGVCRMPATSATRHSYEARPNRSEGEREMTSARPHVSKTDNARVETTSPGPTPRFTGKFSVYDTANGGIHIAWLPDGIDSGETQHIDLPGPIVQIIKSVGDGKMKNPMDIVKAVMGANGVAPE